MALLYIDNLSIYNSQVVVGQVIRYVSTKLHDVGGLKNFPHRVLNPSPTELITARDCCDQVKENLGFLKGGGFLDQLLNTKSAM
jgi:hypothetical protein